VIGLIAGEEVEEHAGLADDQFLPPLPRERNVAEELLGLVAVQEVLLVGRALIGIAGRDP